MNINDFLDNLKKKSVPKTESSAQFSEPISKSVEEKSESSRKTVKQKKKKMESSSIPELQKKPSTKYSFVGSGSSGVDTSNIDTNTDSNGNATTRKTSSPTTKKSGWKRKPKKTTQTSPKKKIRKTSKNPASDENKKPRKKRQDKDRDYICYCLKSKTREKTYIGKTYDLFHRIRQHDGKYFFFVIQKKK